MSLRALSPPRFVRRTSLESGEYRKNFRQIDREIIEAVTSPEADAVTPLMSKIYLRLANAPERHWEREGVLRFEAEIREDGRRVKAWTALCELLGVASATASKALRWMHEQQIIGYFSGKNGVGLRVFLNRASSSIGVRRAAAGEKILDFRRGSSRECHGSSSEAAFNDPDGYLENLDTDLNPRAPKNGAGQTDVVKKYSQPHLTPTRLNTSASSMPEGTTHPADTNLEVPVEEIVSRLRSHLEPALQSAARAAAAQEHERTREWLESRGLPKAARVAQREAFNVLRKYGVVTEKACTSRAEVGRGSSTPTGLQPLAEDEMEELAQACVAMLEVKGQSVDVTLSEMSAEAGGFLLPEDAPRVRQKVQSLLGTNAS